MRYQSLRGLQAAYESGELPGSLPLVIDSDAVIASHGEEQVFDLDPAEVLQQALDLLGIPWDRADMTGRMSI